MPMLQATRADTIRSLMGRFDAGAVQAFQGAVALCQSRGHYEVAPEHLLLRLLDDTTGDVARILGAFKVDTGAVRRAIQRVLDEQPSGHHGKPGLANTTVELLESAGGWADQFSMDRIRAGLVLLALISNPTVSKVGELTSELERIDIDQLRDHFTEIVSAAPDKSPEGGPPSPAATDGAALAQFTIDLTAKAASGGIDPVFGREHEIRQMIDIFARRTKNNPILVGEPGTGKTAIVEGLALRIVQGEVPPVLKGVKLIVLDIGLLQAGAGIKGEFENRLKNVIKEIKASTTPIITFIDEAHTLIGAGGAAGGSDAANLLKPALARGEFRTVAATTWAEYKKYFEKDAALARRFQLVRCDEPSVEDAVVMLRGLKDKYERHHKVIVADEALTATVQLSKRYISGRYLPDKAVDLLDTASARVAVGLTTRPATLEDVDRKLHNLDTAITAIRRDLADVLAADPDQLREMETQHATLLVEREAVATKWEAELQAIQAIRELRERHRAGGRPENNGKGPGNDESVAESIRPADSEESRKQLEAALADLRRIQGNSPLVYPVVDAAAVAAVVSDWTGVPAGKMVKDEISAVLKMEERLQGRVVGQDHAIRIIAQKLRTSKAGIGNPGQPLGVFLCVGPSGVGKTELALSVADQLFGGDRFLVTINMSEFMEKHTVSQLKGSPPGYVGYGEGGVLTEAVRQHPYSVVLLDEVEKAHPEVLNLFYQVFDKGTLADGEGRVIDFKNTVIFLTSNLGTDVIQSMCESGETVDFEALKEGIYPHLREHFKPALVARMTVIPFMTLKPDVLKSIARMKLDKIARRLESAHRMALEIEDAVYERIAAQCVQVDIGARNVDHICDQVVLPELSRRLLEQLTEEVLPARVSMTVDERGEFAYTFA